MATRQSPFLTDEYAGYHHSQVPAEDSELTGSAQGLPQGSTSVASGTP